MDCTMGDVTGFVAFVNEIDEDSSDSETVASVKSREDEDSDDDISLDLEDQFTKLFNSWKKLREENETIKDENLALLLKVEKLNKELEHERDARRGLEDDITETDEKIEKFNGRSKVLNDILAQGRNMKNVNGIGYGRDKNPGKAPLLQAESSRSRKADWNYQKAPKSWYYTPVNRNKHAHRHVRGYECYYCGRYGHIKRNCYKYIERVNRLRRQGRFYPQQGIEEYGYVAREDLYCYMASTPSKPAEETKNKKTVEKKKPWYLDSGASKHMTGDLKNLVNYTPIKESKVVFGGGAKGKIKGKGDLVGEGRPKLSNVYYVEGLGVNLISISQLSDEDFTVSFDKDKCWVYDEQKQKRLSGTRTINNRYVWDEPRDVTCLGGAIKSRFDLIC